MNVVTTLVKLDIAAAAHLVRHCDSSDRRHHVEIGGVGMFLTTAEIERIAADLQQIAEAVRAADFRTDAAPLLGVPS